VGSGERGAGSGELEESFAECGDHTGDFFELGQKVMGLCRYLEFFFEYNKHVGDFIDRAA
jgi:hypothetical protein